MYPLTKIQGESEVIVLSTGIFYDPKSNKIATFTSIWRREASGVWRIVFDKGKEVYDHNEP
jgi:hypothetical protein